MSQQISVADVRHMAKLSRLEVSEAEEEQFARQFDRIIGHINILNEVNTEGVEPLYTPAEKNSSLRLDTARNTRTRDEIMANAPVTDGQCFIVPRIV